jgi:hypothetical protein
MNGEAFYNLANINENVPFYSTTFSSAQQFEVIQ